MITIHKIESPFNSDDQSADIDRNQSIRIYGRYSGQPFDKTFKVGEKAEYDSYNLHYLGTIVGITDKSVTIDPGNERQKKRLKLAEFIWRNYDFDLEKIIAKNSDTMNYI